MFGSGKPQDKPVDCVQMPSLLELSHGYWAIGVTAQRAEYTVDTGKEQFLNSLELEMTRTEWYRGFLTAKPKRGCYS